MTQHPYMWNGNNPVVYSDPSGYCFGPLIAVCAWEGWITVSAIAYALTNEGAGVGPVGPTYSAAAEGAADWAKSTPGVSSKLVSAATALFRGGAQEVSGGAAGAVRFELATGKTVGGKFHLEKGATEINRLTNLLKSGTLNAKETAAAQVMLKDLQEAFWSFNPQSFIGNNKPPGPAPMPAPAPK